MGLFGRGGGLLLIFPALTSVKKWVFLLAILTQCMASKVDLWYLGKASCEPKMVPTLIINHYSYQVWFGNSFTSIKKHKKNVEFSFKIDWS